MDVIGVLWTLYPLLGMMAFTEFVAGLAHIFFCLPFFAALLPLLCGVLASITAVYALMLHFPNRTELLLQFLSAVLAFALFLCSITEASCLRRLRPSPTNVGAETSVCAGILNRTADSQQRCARTMLEFQDTLLVQIANAKALLLGADGSASYSVSSADSSATAVGTPIKPVSAGRDAAMARAAALDAQRVSARIGVASVLTLASLIHLSAGVVLTVYSAVANEFRLSAPHWQVVFGVVTLLLSYIYYSYCCVFFYTYFVTAIAFFCLIQAAVPWHFPARSAQRQLFSVFGAALSASLLALSTFGVFCWANRDATPSWRPFDRDASNFFGAPRIWNETMEGVRKAVARSAEPVGVYRYCHTPARFYLMCERTLQFSTPYVFWSHEQVESEAAIVQIVIYALLTVNSVFHFFLFVYDAFGA